MAKIYLALLVAGFCLVEKSRAQGSAVAISAPAEFTTSISPAYVSQYMFRGQRLSSQAFQPSVELDYGKLGLGIWANLPVSQKVDGVSDPEVDPYAYFTIPLSADLSLVPGVTLYTFPRAETDQGFYRSTLEPNIALSWSVRGVRITPKFYYDVVLEGATYELSAAYALPLKDLGMELDFTGQVGAYEQRDTANHTAANVKSSGRYWLLGMTAPFQLSSSSRVSVGFAYTRGEEAYLKQGSLPKQVNPLATGRSVVTFTYSCTF